MIEEITRAASPRQLKLFHLENPLTLRFGSDFFRSLSEGLAMVDDGSGLLPKT